MSDLPRFHTGQSGSLTFNDLNEVMRRLDRLRPLIETAGVSSSVGRNELVTVFPVFATKLPNETNRYQWSEVVLDEEDAWYVEKEDEDPEDGPVRIRKGGLVDEDTGELDDLYAVRSDVGVAFDTGFAILFATRRTDGRTRYIITPLTTAGDPPVPACEVLRVTGEVGPVEAAIENGTASVNGYAYSVRVIQFFGDHQTGVEVGSAVLYDWSVNQRNHPVSDSTDVSTSYHPMAVNTMVTANKAASDAYHVGMIPRLDWECI